MSNFIGRLKSSFFFLVVVIGTLAVPQLFLLHQIFFIIFGLLSMAEIYYIHINPERTVTINEIHVTDVVMMEIFIIGAGTIAYCCFEREQVIMIQIGVIACDTLAYVIGKLIGRKIIHTGPFPNISPNKSYEGTIGGIVCSSLILLGWISWQRGLDHLDKFCWTALLCTGVFTTIGDLSGSFTKRQLGVKDSNQCTLSHWLLKYPEWPMMGFGGALDRFDSIYFVSAMLLLLNLP